MRLMVVLSVVIGSVVLGAMAPEAGRQGTPGKTPTGACSVLTKELITAHSPASKETLNVIMKIPQQEEKAGAGSSCQHGDVMLQIDPFPVASFERLFGKWMPVPGVGDKAYFRDNQGGWAELGVVAGARMITIQMDVPKGKTAAGIQPNTVSLAKAVLAKLK